MTLYTLRDKRTGHFIVVTDHAYLSTVPQLYPEPPNEIALNIISLTMVVEVVEVELNINP